VSEDFPAHLAGFRPGSMLAGYRLEAHVAAGGMGVVYRARDIRLDRLVALKILAPALAGDPAFRRRFIAESRAAASVDDPHIIPVYEADEADGILFIAMRFVAGGDLRRVLEREGVLSADRAAGFISPVASALDAAYAVGLVHRDVKPGNILVDARAGRPDHVYLSDFGASKGAITSVSLTGPGFLGTPDYAAPEQINGGAVDGRTDQYALACVTYQLLTGVVPFVRDHGMAVLLAHLSAPPPSLTARRPDLSGAADQVLAKAMAKGPHQRYESCGEFADALRQALGTAPYHPRSSAAVPVHPHSPATSAREIPATEPAGDEAPADLPDAGGTVTVGPPGGREGGQVPAPVPVNRPDSVRRNADRGRQEVTAATGTVPASRRRRLPALVIACAVVVAAGIIAFVLTSASNPPKQPQFGSQSPAGRSGPSGSSAAASQQAGSAVAAPKAGGSLTVLEGAGYSGEWQSGLDPATDVDGVDNQDMMDAVYGQLFELGAGGKVILDLATGYQFSNDGKTITIDLRQGVKFTDGSPFDAQVVVWNMLRDLSSSSSCGCGPQWDVTNAKGQIIPGSVKAVGPYTVQINLTSADGAFINQMFDSTPNWIASETSYNKMGEAEFARYPVGAGPFIVVSDVYSDKIAFRRNPGYWQTLGGVHLPYLDRLTFTTVSSDTAAYQGLLAGQGEVYEDMSTTALIDQSASHFEVDDNLGTSPYDLQLNTAIPPFNNPKARQAIYAATNFAPILNDLFGSRYPATESFTGPGGICYEPSVPGYQQYDPTLARQLVAETGLNKVTIQLGTIDVQTARAITAALKAQWAQVGITAAVTSYPVSGLINAYEADGGKKWESMLQTAGSYDPAGGLGISFRFGSQSLLSGVHDLALDAMMTDAQDSTSLATRCSIYHSLAAYIAKNYYAPFYFSSSPANVSAEGVSGPGLSTPLPTVSVTPAVPWENVSYSPSGS
jgi:peptide/nickel transport system substrate-binding protein